MAFNIHGMPFHGLKNLVGHVKRSTLESTEYKDWTRRIFYARSGHCAFHVIKEMSLYASNVLNITEFYIFLLKKNFA